MLGTDSHLGGCKGRRCCNNQHFDHPFVPDGIVGKVAWFGERAVGGSRKSQQT